MRKGRIGYPSRVRLRELSEEERRLAAIDLSSSGSDNPKKEDALAAYVPGTSMRMKHKDSAYQNIVNLPKTKVIPIAKRPL